ncbi:hypothetical protein [Thermophilibacter provencensis]|uniref:hypothetical protein n=1 Tax=Thermophilibacter provencensis TaxID=1852386 RepID=UPI00294264CB|nr:hypothetical protein [Thermophilibacter provencensis]
MRFGWTPAEFDALTPAQLALLRKEDERRTVEVGNLIRDAVQNAVANAMRKRGRKQQPLFRKRAQRGKEPARRVTRAEFGRIEGALRGL